MTDKQEYWLADRAGTKALVVGAAERDRWLPHGWADADEPAGDEFVWASHPGVAEPARFPNGIFREVWELKGWAPSAPPEPVDPLTGVRLPRPIPEPPTAAAAAAKSTTKAAAGGEKEQSRD